MKNHKGEWMVEQEVLDIISTKNWGDPNTMQLLVKVGNGTGCWGRAVMAMQIDGVGCIVNTYSKKYGNVAESTVFVPGVMITDLKDPKGKLIGRKLVKIV
jgi:hypothetical protein